MEMVVARDRERERERKECSQDEDANKPNTLFSSLSFNTNPSNITPDSLDDMFQVFQSSPKCNSTSSIHCVLCLRNKKARDVTFNEGCRLRYKFHERPIHNIDTNEIENE